jgi:hypothetical protein
VLDLETDFLKLTDLENKRGLIILGYAPTTKNRQKKRVRLRLLSPYSPWLVASVRLASTGLDILRFSFFRKTTG